MRLFVSFMLGLAFAVPAFSTELPPQLAGLGLRENAVASRDMPGWSMPKRIVVRTIFGPELAQQLDRSLPGIEVVGAATAAEAVAAMPGAQVLIGFCEQSLFEAADSLHWVQVFFAGVEDCVSLPVMQAGNIVLSNGQRLSSPAIAEYTIGVMLGMVRNLDGYRDAQLQSQWAPVYGGGGGIGELGGRTLLVVGLGGIGTQVAQRAHALGMKVIATRGSRREGPDFIEYVGLAHEAIELAARADVVVNAAPLTKATRGMFNQAFFDAMKPEAYFISVGRGASTVTQDLVAALASGSIAGAALDVTDPEPLPSDHPLWSAPGAVITPHIAAQSPETLQRVMALVKENLKRYMAGDPLLSVVNIKKGY